MSKSALTRILRRHWSRDEDGWSYNWREHVNVAAIVVPIVVGLVAIAAFTFLFVKARRRRQRMSGQEQLPYHSSAPYTGIPAQDVAYHPYQGYQPPTSNDLRTPPQAHIGHEDLAPPPYLESAKDGPGIKE
jgi:hypothetical protein